MEIELRPEPEPREREAIAAALARHRARQDGSGRSAWWRAGVDESVRAARELRAVGPSFPYRASS
jgi:hypothetical protein